MLGWVMPGWVCKWLDWIDEILKWPRSSNQRWSAFFYIASQNRDYQLLHLKSEYVNQC